MTAESTTRVESTKTVESATAESTTAVRPSIALRGTVTGFDEPVGLGTVTDADGVGHPFHCTAIADGSRDIAVGADVVFRLVASRGGRFEARDLVQL